MNSLPAPFTILSLSPALDPHIQQIIDQKTKPPGSLGQLETVAAQIARIQQSLHPQSQPVCHLVFAADHGVCAEQVSPYPSEVTTQMVLNFLQGGAAINVFCRHTGTDLKVINAGVRGELPQHHPLLETRLVRRGTGNMVAEAALTTAEMWACLHHGREVVEQHAPEAAVVSLGEMGIGNSTSAAAIIAALFGWPPAEVVGAGTGASAEMQAHKVAVIQRALTRHALAPDQPLEILRCVGGLEISMMVGAYLRAAALGKVVLVDGFIATSAWAIAHALQPHLRDYSIFAHLSGEQGHARVLAALSVEPLLQLGMRLGEGTGAITAVPLLHLATAFFNEMASFAEAGVSQK